MPRGGPYLIESSEATTKHLYAIIRKPQEGKTFICLENIMRSPEYIHLIVTMNTIKSNNQFFERAKERFGNNIRVFNSRGKKKEETLKLTLLYSFLYLFTKGSIPKVK